MYQFFFLIKMGGGGGEKNNKLIRITITSTHRIGSNLEAKHKADMTVTTVTQPSTQHKRRLDIRCVVWCRIATAATIPRSVRLPLQGYCMIILHFW